MKTILEKIDLTQAILDNSGTLVIIANVRGYIQLFNKACTQLTGYSFNEVQEKTIEELFLLGEEVAFFFETFSRLVSGFQVQDFECHWKTKLDAPRLIHWSTTVLLNDEDRVEYVLFFGVDITDKHEIQNRLIQREERLRLALEAANEGLWDYNPQTGEIYFSPYWYRMLGYEINEFAPSYDKWIELVHPDDRTFVTDVIQASVHPLR